jgi:antitoxin component HigA of HigAB toxin-antitoxin module
LERICTDEDLQAACVQLRRVFQADEGTPEAGERETLVALIEAYEHQQYGVGMAEAAVAGLQDALAGRLLTDDELRQALTQVPRPTRLNPAEGERLKSQ